MYNYCMLIGTVEDLQEDKEQECAIVKINVKRPFSNERGEYETDTFSVKFFGAFLSMALETLKKGKLVAIKGRLKVTNNLVELIGERFMFFNKTGEVEEK